MHVPEISSEAVLPETVQTEGVREVSFTTSPELALADRTSVEAAYSSVVTPGKLMVWLARWTVKLRLTAVAARYSALPAWVAWIVHVPSVSKEASAAETVHIEGVSEVKLTGRADEAVADTFSVEAAYSVAVMAGKLMVWLTCAATLKLTAAGEPVLPATSTLQYLMVCEPTCVSTSADPL